ncbi:MAG: hypothetical protein LBE12_19785 [Planctomycetaceae bacterium]|jgi:hypothetical protein|nr:hypothetical protein [Planctomycetaceae bacterium]
MITVQDAQIQIVYEADGLLFLLVMVIQQRLVRFFFDFVFGLFTTGIFSEDHTKDQEISVIV